MEFKYVVTIYSLSGDEPIIRIFTDENYAISFLFKQYDLFYSSLDNESRELWQVPIEAYSFITKFSFLQDFGYITKVDKENNFSNIDWTEREWKKWDIGTMLLIKI